MSVQSRIRISSMKYSTSFRQFEVKVFLIKAQDRVEIIALKGGAPYNI